MTGPPSDFRRSLPLLGLLLGLTALVYGRGLSNGFVWDDIPLFVQNTHLNGDFDVRAVFFDDLWSSAAIGDEAASGYYRPLMVLGLWVDRAVGGGAAWFGHLHSLLWHLLAVAGAWRLGFRLGPSVGMVGAAMFALHPIQSEAVFWIAARNDLMAAALSFWALDTALSQFRGAPVLAAALAVLACLAKETGLLLPALLVCVVAAGPKPLPPVRAWVASSGALLLGVGVAVLLRMFADVEGTRGPEWQGIDLFAHRLPHFVALVARLWCIPWPLSTAHVLEYLDRVPAHHAVMAAVLGGVLLGVVGWRGGRPTWAALAFSSVAFLPALWAILTTGWMGERYLYIATLGIGWAVSLAWNGGRQAGIVGVAVAGIASLSAIWVRAPDWRDDQTLWQSAHVHTPSPFTAESVGHAIRGAGDVSGALPWFVAALDDPAPLASACVPAMSTAVATRRLVLAAQMGHWLGIRGCADAEFRGLQAISFAATGQWTALEAVLRTDVEDRAGRLRVARAVLARRRGDTSTWEEIRASWAEALPLEPQVEALLASSAQHEAKTEAMMYNEALPPEPGD